MNWRRELIKDIDEHGVSHLDSIFRFIRDELQTRYNILKIRLAIIIFLIFADCLTGEMFIGDYKYYIAGVLFIGIMYLLIRVIAILGLIHDTDTQYNLFKQRSNVRNVNSSGLVSIYSKLLNIIVYKTRVTPQELIKTLGELSSVKMQATIG